jgi:hypothetical protein
VRGPSFSREAAALNCSGLVTLSEAGASSKRDLVLLLVGAALSFGDGPARRAGLNPGGGRR